MASNYWEAITADRMARRRLLKAGAAFSVGAASLALIGCGSDGDDSGGGEEPGGQTIGSTGDPVRGGTVGDYFASIGNYNLVAFYHDGYRNSGITAYDRLMTARTDKRGYVLGAAQSVEVQDGTKVIFKLKPNMVFHDKEPANGKKVTSADIVATQAYVRQLPNAENSGFIRQYVDRMEAPDANTVIYHLKVPYAYTFASTALCNPTAQPIVPEEMLDVLDTHPAVGSGPYTLEDHTFGVRYNYKRFEKYREAKNNKPYFDGRLMVSLTDAVAQEAAFRSEQIHTWAPSNSIVDRLLKELDSTKYKNVTYLAVGLSGFNFMMNFAKGGDRPWKDIRFREAIYRLTDRQQTIDLVLAGKAVVPPGPLHASLEAYQLEAADTEKYFKKDPAAAKQLLSAMNYDTDQEWTINVSSTSAQNASLSEVWQQQIAAADIKVRVEAVPLAELLPKKMQPAQFDMFVGSQPGGDTPFRAIRNQHSDTLDQFNNVGLFDPAMDKLIEQSEQAIDREDNIRLVKQVQTEALNKYSMSYVWSTANTYFFYNGRLQGWEIDPLAGQNYQLNAWFSA